MLGLSDHLLKLLEHVVLKCFKNIYLKKLQLMFLELILNRFDSFLHFQAETVDFFLRIAYFYLNYFLKVKLLLIKSRLKLLKWVLLGFLAQYFIVTKNYIQSFLNLDVVIFALFSQLLNLIRDVSQELLDLILVFLFLHIFTNWVFVFFLRPQVWSCAN